MKRLLLSLLFLTGCAGCEDRGRNDAELFLARVSDIDEDAPLPRRTAQVAALERLVVTTDEVKRAKDTCVHAHTALLHAEESQSLARAALERVTEEGGPTAHLNAEDQAAIQRAIDTSNAAIGDARDSFPACQHAIHELERRYGTHHRS